MTQFDPDWIEAGDEERCPICDGLHDPEKGPSCDHYITSTWDGSFLQWDDAETEYHRVWGDLAGLWYEIDEDDMDESGDEEIARVIEAVESEDYWFWLDETSTNYIYNQGSMISGGGYTVYHEDPAYLDGLVRRLKKAHEWLESSVSVEDD